MLASTHKSMGINQLPLRRAPNQRDVSSKLMQQQESLLEGMIYKDYVLNELPMDPWYSAHQVTPRENVANYHYANLLQSARTANIPVMTLLSKDDFILNDHEKSVFQDLEQHQAPHEATMILPSGDHTRTSYSPEVRDALDNFLSHPPGLPALAKES